MNITPPILDDSGYEDLRNRLVNRISVYNPEWSDHNPSDPGITLLELFAYLGEHVIHRFNQIPETTYVEYLNLLKIPRRPAQPARALLTFRADSLPAKPVNASSRVSAGDIKYETAGVVDVWPVSALGMVKAAAPLPARGSEEYSQVELAMDALDLPAESHPIGYELREIGREQVAATIDANAAVDSMVWIAILNNTDAGNFEVLDEMRARGAILNIGFAPDEAPPDIDEIDPCPGPGAQPVNGAVQWQVTTAQIIDQEAPRYRPAALSGDTTGGLRYEGIVRLKISDKAGAFEYIDDDMRGAGDLPPQLDEENESRVLFWIRAFRLDGDTFGLIRFLDVNVIDCEQTVTARPEYLGVGNAQPDQEVYLNHGPVVADSLQVEVEEAGGWQRWIEVDGFHTSGDNDPHYVLDRVSGTITFGVKRVPQIGQRIRARKYRYGGGRVGNVSAGAIDTVPGLSGVEVANPMNGYGGADDEELSASLRRIPGELRRRDRAVTPGDFRELAIMTPGAGIERAETLELFRPRTRETDAAGVVTVMVWPEQGPLPDQPPVPSKTQLRQVCTWIDQRRLVTTEVYIVPPVYRLIAVAVGLRVKPGYSVDAVRVWVETVLRQYLSPLPPFGAYGSGWPLGRALHGPELEAAALQVEGVEFLEGLEVAEYDEQSASWVKGRVELELDQVPWLLEITVVEGPPLEPGDAIGTPSTSGPVVPVPVAADEC